MSNEHPSEKIFTRALGGLFLPERKTLAILAAQALTEAAASHLGSGRSLELGSGPHWNCRPTRSFSPDLLLFDMDSTVMRAVFEVKLHAASQVTSRATCEAVGLNPNDKLAETIGKGYTGRWPETQKTKEPGYYQIDAYRGWRWWSGFEDEGRLITPDARTQYIHLSLDDRTVEKRFPKALSAKHWIPIRIHTFLRRLKDLVDSPEWSGQLTSDEVDALTVIIYLGFAADSGSDATTPSEWITSVHLTQ